MPASRYPGGRFTRYLLPPVAEATMPKPCRKAWDAYESACDRLDAANREAAEAVEGLSAARDRDRLAAREAAKNGDPIPPPTVPDAQAAYDASRRQVEAVTTLCVEAEDAWLALAEEHRDAWQSAAARRIDTACDTATADLDRIAPTLADLAESDAVRRWLARFPPHRQLASFPPGGPQPLGESLGDLRRQIDGLRPESVDAEIRAVLAKKERQAEIRRKYPTGIAPTSVDPATVV